MINKYLNKITCGDCYELIKELPDKSVQAIYTDIPYLIVRGGMGHSELGHRIKQVQSVELADIRDGIDYSNSTSFYELVKRSTYLFGVAKCRYLIL